jgi:uncharacterized protein YutE (UPF0331/DUF86 family)
MTPPGLDAAMVQVKLRTMRELLDDMDAAGSLDPTILQGDRMLRHGVERILTQLVELAAGINGHLAVARLGRGAATYRESFELAAQLGALPDDLAERLLPSVGLRNVLVHEYAAVDLRLVAAGVERARSDYRAYIKAVAGFLPG